VPNSASPSTPLLRSTTRIVPTPQGEVAVLVLEPTTPLVSGRERLTRLQGADLTSSVDDAVVEAVRGAGPEMAAVVFRADPGSGAGWRFDPTLPEPEALKLGALMMRSHLHLYRRLVEERVAAFFGVELDGRTHRCLLHGADVVARACEATIAADSGPERARARLELWLLDHLALWTTTRLEEFLHNRLPEALRLLDRRRRELESLRARLESRPTDGGPEPR
jgi:hypothetical protein